MSDFKVKFNPPTQNLTLKNTTIVATRLDRLADVVEEDSEMFDGSVLIYDADSDRYFLKRLLTLDPATGNYKLNGGDF